METALRALLVEAAAEGARLALAEVNTAAPSRFVGIRDAGIPYRTLLEAVKAGELRAFRVGHAKFIARDDLDSWIAAHPMPVQDTEATPDDDVADLLDFQRRRAGGVKR